MNRSPEAPEPFNPFWRLVVASAVLFCVTILAYIAAGFGQPAAPVNQFLMRHGALIISIEAGVTVACGLAALSVDRRHTLQRQQPEDAFPGAGDDGDAESSSP
ncbi:MAG: hypothetical protein DWQ34_04095 [Planctomycetota bacterium]|nr:MAG: hypothetical protein DWQ29_14355 [Planctomycetota bacterium]REJ96425.1 MAG: hypothetical protein DWQ34_04095 [Planctomycetota bacterium]REK29696.1 MAG: hypothetical protein DWQ41_03400 [Planctomycetota bacterium]REK30483.1 MAG: hypothetical protein DWQ45_21635 [Planctomycetota bacterium]